jgi:cardiolipin synthase
MKILEALAAEAFCRVADAQASAGNHARILRDAAETYPAWLKAIDRARTYVHLENYIIQEDAAGEMFATALLAARRRGVACRVLYDWLGCKRRTTPAFWSRLEAAGMELRCYNPPHLENPFGWVSRDHRKVLCVDGDYAATGGLCIGHDWLGDPAAGIPPWRDTAIEITGPAVAQIDAAFNDSWAAAGKTRPAQQGRGLPATQPTAPAGAPVGDPAGGVAITVIAGRPGAMGLYRLEQLIAEVVERSLWLTDGYFVATTGYVRALCGAARAGADVRLLVPGSSNWPVVGALSQSAFRPLLSAGVRVFEWNGPMLHAKTAVADSCLTRIGSSNSNLASWVSNRELDVTIQDAALAAQMEAMFEADMQNSTEVVLTPGRSGLDTPMVSGPKRGARRFRRPGRISAGRFVSGAIGFGSTLGASFTQHRGLGPAESLVLSGGGGILLLLGLLALFMPRLIAWPLAVIALWIAAGLLIRAWKLWAGRPDRTPPPPPTTT